MSSDGQSYREHMSDFGLTQKASAHQPQPTLIAGGNRSGPQQPPMNLASVDLNLLVALEARLMPRKVTPPSQHVG